MNELCISKKVKIVFNEKEFIEAIEKFHKNDSIIFLNLETQIRIDANNRIKHYVESQKELVKILEEIREKQKQWIRGIIK